MLKRWTLAILLTTCVAILAGCSSARNASASGDRTSLALQFVQSMADGKYADATKQFDGAMNQAMSADQLKAAWEGLVGQCGAFKKLGGTRTGKEGGFEEVFVAVECEKVTFDVKVVFDKDSKIGGLWFVPHVAASASGDRTSLAIQFVQSVAGGKYADATKQFDSAMSQAEPTDKLKQSWATLIGQHGVFKQLGGTRTGQELGFEEVFVAVEFEKATIDVKVIFDAEGKIGGLWFVPHVSAADAQYSPPAYAHNDRFDEQEVTVGSVEWKLPGTLTVPKGKGPFPAVVLVHGSGPNDRDETIGANKPFKDLAWGLASKGIAVLRYVKRSKFYPRKLAMVRNVTVKEEVIDDALAAVNLLRNSRKIDPKRIFVLGHSNGGLLSPRIGKADPKIAGLIMMAGCGTQPMEDVLLRQLTYIASLNGPITDDTRKEIDKQVQLLMKSAPASYIGDLNDYIPAAAGMAKSLKQPMLIMQGARDYQATTADFNIWKHVLSSRTNVTFKLYPNLNHLFMPGTGKSAPEEYNKRGPIPRYVIDDIAKWVKAH